MPISYSWPIRVRVRVGVGVRVRVILVASHSHTLSPSSIHIQTGNGSPPYLPPYPPFFQEMDRLYEEASRDLRPIASEKNLASRKEALARERLERAAGGTFFMTFHYVIAREGSGRHFFYDFSLCNCSRGQREALFL